MKLRSFLISAYLLAFLLYTGFAVAQTRIFFGLVQPPPSTGTPPTIDGTPFIAVITNGTPTAVNLASSSANDIVVLIAFSNATSGTAPSISTITGTGDFSGLSWSNSAGASALSKVFTSDVDGTTSIKIQFWWVKQTSATNNGNITVTWGAGSDNLAFSMVAAKGIGNTSAPWDTNGSLPASTNSTGGASTIPSVANISTTTLGTMIITGLSASRAAGGQYTDQTAGAGYTIISATHFAPNVDFSALAAQQKGVTSAQSGISSPFTQSYNGWIGMTHALIGT